MKTFYRKHDLFFLHHPDELLNMKLGEPINYMTHINSFKLLLVCSSQNNHFRNAETKNEILTLFNKFRQDSYNPNIFRVLDKTINRQLYKDLDSAQFNRLLAIIDSFDVFYSNACFGYNLICSGYIDEVYSETFLIRNWAFHEYRCRKYGSKIIWEVERDYSEFDDYLFEKMRKDSDFFYLQNELVLPHWLNSVHCSTIEDTLKFGKYKGRSIIEILKVDPKYIAWCILNMNGFIIVPFNISFPFNITNFDTYNLFSTIDLLSIFAFDSNLFEEAQYINDIKTKIYFAFITTAYDKTRVNRAESDERKTWYDKN